MIQSYSNQPVRPRSIASSRSAHPSQVHSMQSLFLQPSPPTPTRNRKCVLSRSPIYYQDSLVLYILWMTQQPKWFAFFLCFHCCCLNVDVFTESNSILTLCGSIPVFHFLVPYRWSSYSRSHVFVSVAQHYWNKTSKTQLNLMVK